MSELLAGFDCIVNHAQERREAGIPLENVKLIGVIADRKSGGLPLKHRLHCVFVILAASLTIGMNVAAAVGAVFYELGVPDLAFGDIPIFEIGSGGEFQIREFFFQDICKPVIKFEPSGGRIGFGAVFTTAKKSCVVRKYAQDIKEGALAYVFDHVFSDQLVNLRIAETDVRIITLACDFRKVFRVKSEKGFWK